MELVKKYAAEQQLEPDLVLSVMKQESSFRPTAESEQGAVGLMQLLPRTAEELEKGIRTQLFQVEPNIRVGTKYLRKLLDSFCGNRAVALAAYNAGMGRVATWRKQGLATEELTDFVESLPARETRDYVGQIIRNHYWYSSRIIDTKAPPPCEPQALQRENASQVQVTPAARLAAWTERAASLARTRCAYVHDTGLGDWEEMGDASVNLGRRDRFETRDQLSRFGGVAFENILRVLGCHGSR